MNYPFRRNETGRIRPEFAQSLWHCPTVQHLKDLQTIDSKVVPGEGLEPSRPCGQRILSPLRLPISPPGRSETYQSSVG